MALSPSTGQLILAAAQGLTQTLQVQAQLAERQREREETQALEVAKLKAQNDLDSVKHETELAELRLKQAQVEKATFEASPEQRDLERRSQEALIESRKAETEKNVALTAGLTGGKNITGAAWQRVLTGRTLGLLDQKIQQDQQVTYIDATGAQASLSLKANAETVQTFVGSGQTISSFDKPIEDVRKRIVSLNDPIRLSAAKPEALEVNKNLVAAANAELNSLLQKQALAREVARTRGEAEFSLSAQALETELASPEEKEVAGRIIAVREPLSVVSQATNLPLDLLQNSLENFASVLRGKITREQLTDQNLATALDSLLRQTAPAGSGEEEHKARRVAFFNAVLR